jgi:hypothetical protein
MGTGPIFAKKRTFSTFGQNSKKWGLSAFSIASLTPNLLNEKGISYRIMNLDYS